MKFIERFTRQPAKPVDPGAAPLLMALEPRMMFDASVGVVTHEAVQASSEPTADSASVIGDARTHQGAQGPSRQEVVFVDGQVGNLQQLLAGLAENAEVVVLDPTQNGLQQMASYLQGREGLDAVHLLSHGAEGTVQVGNTWLASSNLLEHRAALESIGSALKADGDLMLYGCRVGDSGTGQAFIDQLADITKADVAASADDTGSALLDGNWTLERSNGVIETSALAIDSYEGVLVASWSTGSSPLGGTIATGGRTVVGDFDGDGDTDILYQTGGPGSAWSYVRSNGDGTFTAVSQAQSPFVDLELVDHSGTNYHVGDFDGDGDVDILIGVNGTTGNFLRNDGASFTLASSAAFPMPNAGSRMAVGDFDGDGDADILYQTGGNGSAWAYARSQGGGNFTLLTLANSPFAGLTLPDGSGNNYHVADFDGDGDLDVLATVNNATGTYLRNNGNGTFSSVSTAGFPSPAAGGRVLVGDFDSDGNADILYQTGANGSLFQYAKSNGDGTFTIMPLANSPLAGLDPINHDGSNYRVGDFDGDGDLDIFSAGVGTSGNLYLQNGAAPELVSTTPFDNSLSVQPSANIVLTFSESVAKGSGNIHIVRTSDNQIIQTIDVTSAYVTGSGVTWTIDPPADLAQGTAYAVRIGPTAFIDTNGTVFKGISNNTTLNFTTATVLPPVIGNLDGDSVNYREDAVYTLLDAAGNAIVTDADSANFAGGKLTVQITAGGTASQDELFIRDQGAGTNNITLSGTSILYNGFVIGTYTGGSNGNPLEVTYTANATPATVAALIHNLAYRNTNTVEPSTTPRAVSISMNDGAGGNSTVSVVDLHVVAINDTPQVNVIGTNPTYTEGTLGAVPLFSNATIDTRESGQQINTMTFTVTGLANGADEVLVINGVAMALTNGNSASIGNGITASVSVASGTATVTLSSSGMDVTTAQTILNTMAYRNASEGPSPDLRVVTLSTVSDNGGWANGGSPTATIGISSTVTVIGINDAPTMDKSVVSPAPIEAANSSSGMRVLDVLRASSWSDVDFGALNGIAVTDMVGNGTWQYSTDNANWTDFGAVSDSSALLLAGSAFIRYLPDEVGRETALLTYRCWDQSTGSASKYGIRNMGDASSIGGTTAFSLEKGEIWQRVSNFNDAPVMTGVAPTLNGLTDTSIFNAGQSVSSLIGGITDVNTGAVKGIAITGLTSTYGIWQFSTDSGSRWSNVGSVSVDSALLLRPTDVVRFRPDGVHGETATITYKAWDQTGGSSGMHGVKMGVNFSGGTSAFSVATDTASVVVTAVNDAPVVTVSSGSASWTEGNNVASTPVAVDPGLSLVDADGPNPTSASVQIFSNYYSTQDTLSFVNDGLTMGNIIGTWTAGNGTLTLTSAGNTATVAQFEAALRVIAYDNNSNSPNTSQRTVQFVVTDGGNFQSTTVTRDITIVSVNDSPTITTPVPASLPITEDTPTALGQITFSDVDNDQGTVTLSVSSGALSATAADGVTVTMNGMAMILSGPLANINTFIANSRLFYTPAGNASGDVTLTINLNTNTESDSTTTTVTLQVAAVNDAPVVSAPEKISVFEDVLSVIKGISFSDVDAGANTVTATFSVPSGTLFVEENVNVEDYGLSVSGSGTGVLILSGSLADINAFIPRSFLLFKTAQDATDNVVLSVTLNDKGFSGSGGEQTDTKTITLEVIAANDRPVNHVPSAQTAQQNIPLDFNTANGNAISIADLDVGTDSMTVTLRADHGTLSLGSWAGLTLLLGTGTNDASITVKGSLTDLNAALQTLSFTSASGFLGATSLFIETDDNGNTGTGGPKSDADSISINVLRVNPQVISVSAQGLDRVVKVGDEVLISTTWDQDVNVDLSSGTPSLLLETGLVDRNAVYESGTGTNTLVFKYIVQAGDFAADLDFQSTAALQTNGATLNGFRNNPAVLILPTVGSADSLGGRSNIVVDGVTPVVGSVQAPPASTYGIGQSLNFTVNFSEQVVVDPTHGVPRIAVTLDTGGTVYAEYFAGSGTSALVFRLTVASGQLDSTGVTLDDKLQLNGGSIRDSAGNDTVVTLNNVATTANVNIDGVVPTVVSVTTPLERSYKAGDVLTFTVNTSEAVQVAGQGPQLVLDVGGVTRLATYVSGSGSAALEFQYTVQMGDSDADGIAINSLDLRNEPLTDLAGNDLDLTLNGLGSTTGIYVDTQAPYAPTVAMELISDSGVADGVTNTTDPSVLINLQGTHAQAGDTVELLLDSNPFNPPQRLILSEAQVSSGAFNVSLSQGSLGGDGSKVISFRLIDQAGNIGAAGGAVTIVLDTNAPSMPTALVLTPGSDSGILGDGRTNVLTPTVTGTAEAGSTVTLYDTDGTTVLGYGLADNQNIWTITSSLLAEGAHSLTAKAMDVAGNTSVASAVLELNIDTQRPTASISVADTALKAGETSTVTITFSEAVNGLELADFSVDNGALSLLVSSDNGKTWTATLTPDADVTNATNLITLNNAGVTDDAGNIGTNTTDSNPYAIDTLRPSASIVVANTALKAGETSTVTITFTEAVNGLELADFSVENGALSLLVSSDNGKTWTATLTPDADVTDATNLITLNNAGVTDDAGNTGEGTTPSSNYTIDTLRPSASIVVADTALKAGETSTVTITFNEAVNGLDLADFRVENGALSLLVSSDNGKTWTATLTPDADVTDATNLITLNNTGVTDAAGNIGAGTTVSSNYAIDTLLPTASISVSDTALKAGESSTVTITFNEAVNGLELADFSVENGVLSLLVSSDNGKTWTATLTPDADVTDATNLITLNNADVTDAAGNIGAGASVSSNYAIDTRIPVTAGVDMPTSGTYLAGQVLDFTVDFSEQVEVDTATGNPRLAITLDNGRVVYADYFAGSGSAALVFRLSVTAGMSGNDHFSISPVLDLNGASIRDGMGNDANPELNNVGDSRGIIIDAKAPQPTSIVIEGTVLPSDRSLSFILTFDEVVSGVDLSDFSLIGTHTATGVIKSVQAIDGRTFRLVVGDLMGQGSLALQLKAAGSAITDAANNLMTQSLVGQAQHVHIQDIGDVLFRMEGSSPASTTPAPTIFPLIADLATQGSGSPLLPASLFEVRTVGGGLQPLGIIFLGNGASSPSFIAQVFGTSSGGGSGFLGFGGGEAGVFGSSTFAGVFGRELPGLSEMNVFSGGQWKQSDLSDGLRGVFGVPTFGQQLQQINEVQQRDVRDLAIALTQSGHIGQQS